MSRHVTHPIWCGQGHVCTANRTFGEHRSHPVGFDTPTGRIVATRIETHTGVQRVEIRTVVDLAARADRTDHAARLLVFSIHQAIVQARSWAGRR